MVRKKQTADQREIRMTKAGEFIDMADADPYFFLNVTGVFSKNLKQNTTPEWKKTSPRKEKCWFDKSKRKVIMEVFFFYFKGLRNKL